MKNNFLFLLLLLSLFIVTNTHAQDEVSKDSLAQATTALPPAILAQILENQETAWQKVANTTTPNKKDSVSIILGQINNLLRLDDEYLIYQVGAKTQKFRFNVQEEGELNYFQIEKENHTTFDAFIQKTFPLLNYAFTNPDKDYTSLANDTMELVGNATSWNPDRIVGQMGLSFNQEMVQNWDFYRSSKLSLRTFISNLLIENVKKNHGKWCYIDHGKFNFIAKKLDGKKSNPQIIISETSTPKEQIETTIPETKEVGEKIDPEANIDKETQWLSFLMALGGLMLLGLIGFALAFLLFKRNSNSAKSNDQLTGKLLNYITDESNPIANTLHRDLSGSIKDEKLESLIQIRKIYQGNQVDTAVNDLFDFIQNNKNTLQGNYEEASRKKADEIKAVWNYQQENNSKKEDSSTGQLVQRFQAQKLQKIIAQSNTANDLLEALKGLLPPENHTATHQLGKLQTRLKLGRTVKDQVKALLAPKYQERYPDLLIQIIHKLKRQTDIKGIQQLLAIFDLKLPQSFSNGNNPKLQLLKHFKEKRTNQEALPTVVHTIEALKCMGDLEETDYSPAIDQLIDKELTYQAIQKVLDGAENIDEVRDHISDYATYLMGETATAATIEPHLTAAKSMLNHQQIQAYLRNFHSKYRDFYSGTEAISYPIQAADQKWFYTQLFETTIHFYDFMQVSIEGMKNVSKFAYLNYEMILQGKSRTDFPAGSYVKYEEYNAHQSVRTIRDFAKQSGVEALEGVFVRGYYLK